MGELTYRQRYSIATMLATNSLADTLDRMHSFGIQGEQADLFAEVIDRAIGQKRDGHLSPKVLLLVKTLEVDCHTLS